MVVPFSEVHLASMSTMVPSNTFQATACLLLSVDTSPCIRKFHKYGSGLEV